MKLVDLILHPGTLLVLAAVAIVASAAITSDRQSTLSDVPEGLCGGLCLFASAALVAAVIRRGQMERRG